MYGIYGTIIRDDHGRPPPLSFTVPSRAPFERSLSGRWRLNLYRSFKFRQCGEKLPAPQDLAGDFLRFDQGQKVQGKGGPEKPARPTSMTHQSVAVQATWGLPSSRLHSCPLWLSSLGLCRSFAWRGDGPTKHGHGDERLSHRLGVSLNTRPPTNGCGSIMVYLYIYI